jgi:hypothetical protein
MVLDSNEYSTEEPAGTHIQESSQAYKRQKQSLFYDISIKSENTYQTHNQATMMVSMQ